MRAYLSKDNTLRGRVGRYVRSCHPVFFCKLVMRGIQTKGQNVPGEGGVWGSSSLIFIPAAFFQGEEGFLSLFSLNQKCHGLGAWWVLLTSKACCCCLVTQSCSTLCDPMDCTMPGFPVLHHLPELAQTHVNQVSDAIQLSHPLLSPSPPAFSLSQHLGLF